MQVESSFSISEAERVIRELEGRRTDTVLTLPTRSRANVGGGEPAVLQAVLTWASAQSVARIRTYARDSVDQQLETLTSHLVGTCAALLCDRADGLDHRDVTAEVRELALERLHGLQGSTPRNWSRGSQIEILCADHLGWSSPETLYATSDAGNRLLSRKEFDRVAELILQHTVPDYFPAREDHDLRIGIADALYELFRNTDEYGRADEHGNSIGRSIRGLHARRQAISRTGLAKMVEASRPLADYCDRLEPRGKRRDIQLLELSVFDSGPGYAPHWLGRPLADITREEELEAIETCFDKHATRKANSTAGMGLSTVVDILRRRNGFMRLRTGRQSLYADLGLQVDQTYGAPPKLSPWQDFRLAPAAGTLFTFLLPL
ncbi:hypothetical protein KZX46_21680 (plasmid) [Polymorphobacter sp. PAMC 29334]|uniref:hypothetical protein n=1 Tax=Polymorphobacter sp. PAMC 29334 TaxID=2862331 RepID=UPI001C759F7A|nr:hypothetical protein [Polymorphobacter sp. PAMC 29334]QYE37247.1 hypothetical protein KZX46_21680 [Polymorphobacter sp. PAMC 29334]